LPELRKDMVRDNWVVIVADNALKPGQFPINRNQVSSHFDGSDCPFCEGHEARTTQEIAAVRLQGSLPDAPGWLVRTVPNKFAAFNLEGELHKSHTGLFECFNGLGHHEVVVETPWHYQEIHQRSPEHIGHLYRLLRQRYQDLKQDSRIKYIQIYKNRGLFAGASQQHSHSQILAYPMVPEQSAPIRRYYQKHRRCLICDTIEAEKAKKVRIVAETDYFLLLCPYASRFSYEAWIIPKTHTEHYDGISDLEIEDLAVISKAYVGAMMNALDQPAYNISINTAPVNNGEERGYHWFMEITPRLMVMNAVEIGTGFYMNPVAPERAAQILGQAIRDGREVGI
jgi:UDPglucose--hexose-1-phosphate uridylyltransferase